MVVTLLLKRSLCILVLLIVLAATCGQAFALAIGDRIKVISSNGVKIRDAAAGKEIGTAAPSGYRGKITDGYIIKSLNGVSYTWWKIDWDSSSLNTGWSIQGDSSGNAITYVPSTTVTFKSEPSDNVRISVSPNDQSGKGSGDTTFTRTWDDFPNLTLGASATLSNGNQFVGWQKNGSQYSTNTSISNVQITGGDTFTAIYQAPQASSGSIELKVNNSGGNALAVAEMNSIILFDATASPVKSITPPGANPMQFTGVPYADYYAFAFCWDTLSAESGSFTHNQSLTKRTFQANPKRPLNVTVASKSGTPLEGAVVDLYSLNLQSYTWTKRASATTGSNGKVAFSAWPNIHAGEKYKAVASVGGLVGSREDFTVPTASAGTSIIISVSDSTKPVAVIDQVASVSLGQKASFSGAHSTPAQGRSITSYQWYFSDGKSDSGSTVSHKFEAGTEGFAILTVSDGSSTSFASVRFPLKGVGNPAATNAGASLDPVNTATGNFIMNPTLLSVSARGLPFVFQAFYNSKAFDLMETDSNPGPLGFGWTHNFEMSASAVNTESELKNVIITFGDGHREKYQLIDGVWIPELGIYNQLTQAESGAFALLSPNQIKSQFDASGKLIGISDRNGNTLTVVWEPLPTDAERSRITRVELPGDPDTSGNIRKVLFDYDDAGHLQKLTDPIGRTVEFTVDSQHDLRTVKNPRGYSTAYTYDGLHQLLTGTDARSHVFVENVYSGRAVAEQYDADRNRTTFDYPFTSDTPITFTRITRWAEGGNEVTEDYHDEKLQLVERIVRNDAASSAAAALSDKFGYDPETGDRTSVTDRNGNRYQYEYTRGNVTKVTAPDTSVTQIAYNDFNDPVLKTSNGLQAKWEYDERGNVTSYTFPYDSGSPQLYRRSYTPDSHGQITSATDANGHTTRTYFNESGGIWMAEDAEGNQKIFDLDGLNRTTAVTDEGKSYMAFALNENGGIETTTFWSNPGKPSTIKQVFDENDNRTSVEDQLHRFSYFDFDAQDRPYKARNNLLRETVTHFDALGRVTRVEDAKHHSTKTTYDLAGRAMETTDQEGRTHTYTRDANGNILTDTDSDGVKAEYAYDSMNRRTSTRLYTSASAFDETLTRYNLLGQVDWLEDGKHQRTSSYYNDAGQLNRLVDAANQEFTWTYDFEGNLLSASHPSATGSKMRYQTFTDRNQLKTRTDENGQSESFFYDAMGNLDHTVNADGQTTTYAYDTLHRLDTVGYPNGPPVKFTYDDAGQRLTMQDALGASVWTYTTLGQVETSTDPYGQSLTFGYDENGNRTSVTYPGNKTATYAYDDSNLLKSVTDWQTRTISRGYTAAGRVNAISFPNGVKTLVGYDAAGRENDLRHQRGTDAPFIHLGYGFDEAGGIKEISPDIHPLARKFSAKSSTYTYDDANQLLTIDGTAVTHDHRGNLLTGKLSGASGATDSLSWDAESRLVGFTIGGTAGTNGYDGLGHRLQATRGDATKRFVVDGTGPLAQVMAETDGSGGISAYYLYAGGLAARILPDGTVSYYHSDRQGNTLALTDGGGSTTDLYQYDEFGVPAGASGTTPNPFRYLGGFGVYDNGDGTLFARARHYDPGLGRFLSRDPLFGNQHDGESLNRYVYALNAPLDLMDASGLNHGTALNPSFYDQYAAWSIQFANEGGKYVTGLTKGFVGSALSTVELAIIANSNDPQLQAAFLSSTVAGAYNGIKGWANAGYPINSEGIGQLVGSLAFSRGMGTSGNFGALRGSGVLENAVFAQKTYSSAFSLSGKFPGQTIKSLAGDLTSGISKSSGVPIEYIVRDGNTLMLNTRSAMALDQAGIPRSEWSAVNMTGNSAAEARLTEQLRRNGLDSAGFTNPISN